MSDDVMGDLRTLAAQLNHESNVVSKEIMAFEETLRQLALGVEAVVRIPNGSLLGYVKREGRWGLAVDNIWLRDAQRTTRAAAIKYLPNLMIRLRQNAEYELKRLRSSRGSDITTH